MSTRDAIVRDLEHALRVQSAMNSDNSFRRLEEFRIEAGVFLSSHGTALLAMLREPVAWRFRRVTICNYFDNFPSDAEAHRIADSLGSQCTSLYALPEQT
jgi:hypothetical protein